MGVCGSMPSCTLSALTRRASGEGFGAICGARDAAVDASLAACVWEGMTGVSDWLMTGALVESLRKASEDEGSARAGSDVKRRREFARRATKHTADMLCAMAHRPTTGAVAYMWAHQGDIRMALRNTSGR